MRRKEEAARVENERFLEETRAKEERRKAEAEELKKREGDLRAVVQERMRRKVEASSQWGVEDKKAKKDGVKDE